MKVDMFYIIIDILCQTIIFVPLCCPNTDIWSLPLLYISCIFSEYLCAWVLLNTGFDPDLKFFITLTFECMNSVTWFHSLSLSCTYLSLKFLVPPFDKLMTIITGCLECILLDFKQKEKWLKKPKQRKLQNYKLYEARNFDCIWVWFRINLIILYVYCYWF